MWVLNSKFSAGIYLFRESNENTRTICEICSKLAIKTQERRHWLKLCRHKFNLLFVFYQFCFPRNKIYFHVGVFRTHLIIYDEAFLRRSAVNYSHKKSFIVNIRLSSKLCIFTSLILKTYLHVTNEKDPTHIIWKLSNQIQ